MASYHELDTLQDILGLGLTTFLLCISRNKLFEYNADFSSMPPEVMARLNFIVKLVGYLKGAYNKQGVRDWFFRPRAQLDDKAPIQFLGTMGDWRPEDPLPQAVMRLAESLGDASGT